MGLADRSLPVKGVVRSVNRLRPDANGNVSIISGTPSDGGTVVYNSTTNVFEVAPRGIDLDSTKVAEQAPDDAVIWFPANAADFTVSALAADRAEVLAPTEAWEGTAIQEVSVWFEAGQFHMMYSGGWIPTGLGYATADHPLGPWTKHPNNPVIGLGNGGEAGNAKVSFHFIDDDGEHYTYYAHNWTGSGTEDVMVATGKPPTLTKVGVALTHTATAPSMQNVSVVNDGGTYRMIFESRNAAGTKWQLGYATASSPLGPFTVQQYPLTDLQVGTGGYSGPHLRPNIDGTGWVLLYHASSSGVLPTQIYRATSADLLTWTQDAVGPLVGIVENPPEFDQVADPHYFVCDFGAYLYWEGVNNGAETSSVMASQVTHGDPQWFDGDAWHTLWPAEGEVTQAELDAAQATLQAEIDALAAQVGPHSEVLMSDDGTLTPLTTNAGDDWLYGLVSD